MKKVDPFNNIIKDIIDKLSEIEYKGDISDIGNEVGFAIGKYIKAGNIKNGEDLNDFLFGLHHGISLTNGTH